MNCLFKRDIFNFYEYKDCKKCKGYLEDKEFLIGRNRIYLYYLRDCTLIDVNLDVLFNYEKKVKLFLKDAVLSHEKIITLVLEMNEFEKRMEEISSFLDLEMDIHILII